MKNKNIGYLLTLSAKMMKHLLNRKLERLNITASQWAVIKDLQMLSQYGAAINQYTAVEIAKRLDMDKPTMSGVLNRLIEKDYIKKKSHPEDRRAQVIQLTDTCIKMIPTIEEESNNTIETALKDFDIGEREEFVRLLNKVILNLKGE